MSRVTTLMDVARLIPMLASPLDGEVTATARAIQRRLAANGMDLIDLARELTTSAQKGFSPPPLPRSKLDLTTVLRRIREIRDSALYDSLSPWDAAMLELIAGHAGAGRALTQSQEEILAKICAKAGTARDANPQ